MSEVPVLPPSGTVTMLFTDIEGSTAAARALGERWPDALAAHHRILGRAIEAHRGHIEGTEGDAFFATFPAAGDALEAARQAQEALRVHAWAGPELRVRMGIHTGTIERTRSGLVGLEIHRAARIAAAAHGGQVVVSASTRALAPPAVVLDDLGEHRLRDFPQPERLSQLVVDGVDRRGFPPLRTLPVRPTNIPALESPLIGREAELDRVRSLLTGEARLVTLTGRGGTGKTRLALGAGVELLEGFPGGVWFVSLADVDDPVRVVGAIAERLGVGEESGRPLLATVADRMERDPTLLILDNLEQLAGVAELIDRLLGAAPSARVLATSQVPLQLKREHVIALPPLAAESGVRLFLEQAARRGADAADEGSLRSIAVICDRLDGLPLAIELAAARTVALTPDELLDRLGEGLDILRSRDRDRPARQRSLRATVEWSLGLLDPEDAELFASLSVFAGTFTVSDAEAVAGADALDGLEALVDCSFVRRIATEDHAARFTIAQALRVFARERLTAGGRLADARAAHARWVLARAETGWAALIAEAPDYGAPLAGLGDDVRAALDFAREHDPPLHLQLAGAVAATATELAAAVSLAAELDHAIAAAPEPGPFLARVRLDAGDIALYRGEHAASLDHLEQARALALEHGPAIIAVMALAMTAYVKLATDPAAARALAEQALAESETAGGRSQVAIMLAQVDVAEGRVEVEPLLGEQLEHVRHVDRRVDLWHLYADCALLREDGPTAAARYAAALREFVVVNRDVYPTDLEGLAMALAVAGRAADALEVDAIAAAHRLAFGTGDTALFWEQLRARHLDPIRAAAGSAPDPSAITDLIAARDRALALADAVGHAA